jgi:hypothetical protein
MAKHIVSPGDFKKNAVGQVKRTNKPVGIKDLKKRLGDSALFKQQKRKALEAEKYYSG